VSLNYKQNLVAITADQARQRAILASPNEDPIVVGETESGVDYACPQCGRVIAKHVDRSAYDLSGVALQCRCGDFSIFPTI
jgi:hypothetical protein